MLALYNQDNQGNLADNQVGNQEIKPKAMIALREVRRNPMRRAEKTKLVEDLHQRFTTAKALVITHYTGLTVADSNAIRISMRQAGEEATAQFKITKNRIARIALKGTPFEGMADHFNGPTAIGTAQDPVTAAKILVDFAKESGKLSIVSGAIGSQTLNADEVKALAALPSLEELRGRLVGLLLAPQTKLARVIQAPASQLARVAQARGEQTS